MEGKKGEMPHPTILPSNRPQDRFYLGGDRISSFRHEAAQGPRTPEDWIASTTTCRGCSAALDVGQTRLPNGGSLLKDEVTSDPISWLGAQHLASFGADTKLLVKLLDAEAWYFLTGGEVFIGLRRDVSLNELYRLVETQDVDALTGLMHRLVVQPHQTVYVPPGTLHAIGAGLLIVEVQEPEDLSILLEWKGFQIDGWKDGFLGLDPKRALEAVQRRGQSGNDIRGLLNPRAGYGDMIVPESAECFRLERIAVDGKAETSTGFAIVIVLDGEFEITTQNDHDYVLEVKLGSTIVVPHRSGMLTLNGTGEILVALPPAPK
ncbi:Hypothetical protein PENO1_103220 [Penicillium occitanis (nom. inval.)]|nr:Hypothetical protein PENO1_103220 [Penicillium occitanis (nom. inval.)]PCG90066.1 hypothetical protein PENOC_103840 [Penicillium occitanis (nom. inval.)]